MSEVLKMIPLLQLKRAKLNARKTGKDTDIKGLAASIAAHGLLQNLTVRPAPDSGNGKDASFEVVAGGRRLAALKLLAKRKKLDKDFAVPCLLVDGEQSQALEASLAENVMRMPLHPADQFEAFKQLAEEGHGPEAIAARFGVTATVVRQRLKLAAVSPRLVQAYRNGDMTLDQLMAFTISDDHEAQERVWFVYQFGEKTPHSIRRSLTQTLVDGNDRRARFVGAETYEAAGGTVVRDLFDEEGEGYFEDSQLLDRLVEEKLSAEAEKIKAEGWSWVEPQVETDFETLSHFVRLQPAKKELSKRKQKQLDSLCGRHDEIIADLEEQEDQDAVAELNRITDEIDELTASTVHWSKEDKERAGAIVSLDYQGGITVTRGLVKPEQAEYGSAPSKAKQSRDGEAEPQQERNGGYSEALIEELTAYKTAALQETIAGKPDVALTALLHVLILRIFFGERQETCVDVKPTAIHLKTYAESIAESPAAVAIAERHEQWAGELPSPDGLWEWLSGLGRKRQLELLAYCTARTINAVRCRRFGTDGGRLDQAETLAQAMSLDMSNWWQPTRASYLDRVTKQQIVEAVSEAVSDQASENIASMKKAAMSAKAEELLDGTGWLPEPLRTELVDERSVKVTT